MKTVSIYLFLLLDPGFQPVGRYVGFHQFCDGMYGKEIRWSLDIKPNNTYDLTITMKPGDYLKKTENIYVAGIWKSDGDTLLLYQWGKAGKALTFYQQNGKLRFQKRKLSLEERDFLYLDYLQKTGE